MEQDPQDIHRLRGQRPPNCQSTRVLKCDKHFDVSEGLNRCSAVCPDSPSVSVSDFIWPETI